MTTKKQKKAATRRKDFLRRKNINKYQSKTAVEEKVPRLRPVIDGITGRPVLDADGTPKMEHTGYKTFIKKNYPVRSDGKRKLAIEFPKTRKYNIKNQ